MNCSVPHLTQVKMGLVLVEHFYNIGYPGSLSNDQYRHKYRNLNLRGNYANGGNLNGEPLWQ